jgi:hypothetical protein
MTALPTPLRNSASKCHCIKGLPCTGNKGLGQVSVSGRMRSPRPAASSMAATGGSEGFELGGIGWAKGLGYELGRVLKHSPAQAGVSQRTAPR